MSDLKYRTVKELQEIRESVVANVSRLSSQLAGAKQKLEWVDRYIYEKTPQEMSIRQIEARLGHRVIIMED